MRVGHYFIIGICNLRFIFRGLDKLKNVYQKSPDISPCERTPVPKRSVSALKQIKSASQASFLSTTKSSKHTIKIFLVSFVVLKIQYVCLFPPFIQVPTLILNNLSSRYPTLS